MVDRQACSYHERHHFGNSSHQNVRLGECIQEVDHKIKKVSLAGSSDCLGVNHFIFRKETNLLLRGGLVQAFNLGFFFVSQLVMTFLLFTIYTASGGELSPKKIFTTVSLLFGLRVSAVIRFTVNIIYVSEAKVAISRLQVS